LEGDILSRFLANVFSPFAAWLWLFGLDGLSATPWSRGQELALTPGATNTPFFGLPLLTAAI